MGIREEYLLLFLVLPARALAICLTLVSGLICLLYFWPNGQV
jgi:hypothetical protein